MPKASVKKATSHTEVSAKHKRRTFTAAYKASILSQADACSKPGDLGALLRREGLYSSHLAQWRQQRDQALAPRKRGRRVDPDTGPRRELEKLKRENERLTEKLRQAELIIHVQKKVAAMLQEQDQDGAK